MTKTTESPTPSENIVIEWAPFELKEGVCEEALLSASKSVQTEFLEKQRGYIKRELFKGKGNHWVDLVYWNSSEDAEQATRNVHQSAVCLTYFGMMSTVDPDDPNQGVAHYQRMAYWD